MAQKKRNNRPYNGHKTGFNEEEIREMEDIVKRNKEQENSNENETPKDDFNYEEFLNKYEEDSAQAETTQKGNTFKKKVLPWIVAIGSGLALVASGIMAGMAISNAKNMGGRDDGSEED